MKEICNFSPIEVCDFDVRCGTGQATYLAPGQYKYGEVIPFGFFDKENPYRKWLEEAETKGFDPDNLVAKPGIDRRKALRHFTAFYNSYKTFLKGDKEGILAFLLYSWFEPEPLGLTEAQLDYLVFEEYMMG